MQGTVRFLELLNGRVAYRELGYGPKCLLVFHGFGQDGSVLLPLMRAFPEAAYTCYFIDLPFHGQTKWEDPVFSPGDLMQVIRKLTAGRPWEGLGHSLGGRLWISLLPELKQQPERLYLLAPDGLGSSWGGLIDHTPAGMRYRTARWLKRPIRFLQLVSLLRDWGVIDRFALRYLQTQLATEATRQRLFGTWQSLLAFKLGKNRAQQILAGADCPVEVGLGNKDILVPARKLTAALEGMPQVHLKLLDCGHWDIVKQWQPAKGAHNSG
jgi:pimeloyl-ACP methyl ester carboxylesterase